MTNEMMERQLLIITRDLQTVTTAYGYLGRILQDQTMLAAMSSVTLQNQHIILILPTEPEIIFPEFKELRRIVSKIVNSPWEFKLMWNSEKNMWASYGWVDTGIEMWYGRSIETFPIDEISPGCKIVTRDIPASRKFSVACPCDVEVEVAE